MTLVRSRTSIPVPAVHLFEDSPSNNVGVQFIVMDHIEGVHLYRIWDDITLQHSVANGSTAFKYGIRHYRFHRGRRLCWTIVAPHTG
jgi:hypothetical protein